MGLVVYEMALRVIRFYPVYVIPPLLHIHIHVSSGGWTMGLLEAQLHRDTISPHRDNKNNALLLKLETMLFFLRSFSVQSLFSEDSKTCRMILPPISLVIQFKKYYTTYLKIMP
jgi:hypothetical protein